VSLLAVLINRDPIVVRLQKVINTLYEFTAKAFLKTTQKL